MSKLFVKLGGLLASLAFILSITSGNGVTGLYYSQPKLPDKVKALRKF